MSNDAETTYELYYWPSLQGRGELIRLALEDAGARYVDVARLGEKQGGGVTAMMRLMRDGDGVLPFAPPFLKVGDLVLGQTANILYYLGPRLGLAPADEPGRLHANQLQLTIADLIDEAHDTHHPIATSQYYEDQKPEAEKRAAAFVRERVPKFLTYFERLLDRREASGGAFLLGAEATYPDLSMFQVLTGLEYAFPNAMARLARTIPRLRSLEERVAARPRLAAYLASERRVPFNQSGIFRHYPELDP